MVKEEDQRSLARCTWAVDRLGPGGFAN